MALSLKEKALYWAAEHPYAVFLDSCGTSVDRYGAFEWMAAVGTSPKIFRHWASLVAAPPSWKFGFLSYELKDQFETGLPATEPASIPVPELLFFVPELLIAQRKGSSDYEVLLGDGSKVRAEIDAQEAPAEINRLTHDFKPRISREEYLQKVDALRTHIRDGDIYEINFCQEFLGEGQLSSPQCLFKDLLDHSPTPFAAFLRLEEQFVLGASPERFLSLQQDCLTTQPIKGTIGRGDSPEADRELMERLRASEKEKAENVMIVDLSRNDLYRSCETDSVRVPHLFEVQTFPQVHHLVSTIQGQKKAEISAFQALQNAFPPGSMTGAPKVRAMELISKFEERSRGIYSGSVGYFDPEGNFDLNVVIRTLLHDRSRSILSYQVGGAITYDSDPVREYEETLLKAAAIQHVMS